MISLVLMTAIFRYINISNFDLLWLSPHFPFICWLFILFPYLLDKFRYSQNQQRKPATFELKERVEGELKMAARIHLSHTHTHSHMFPRTNTQHKVAGDQAVALSYRSNALIE